MTSEDGAAVTVNADALAALEAGMGQLTDLFVRRLRDDAGKNALIETVQQQVREANDRLKRRDFESLFKEALLAVDRLRNEPPSPELVESAVDELMEVFRRRDLVEVAVDGEFDPRVHEAVATVPARGELVPNTIASVERSGYVLGDRLLRPAQVTLVVRADEQSA